MSGLGEGIGTAIEGGLLGRAVEPGAVDGPGQSGTAVACANCGTGFTGKFCPECGQKAHIHRSLAAIGHDIMHGVLHLDGKLWNTLPLLAFKPGKLTRRYIDGERAKFVSPMAMFLFTVFAMFAVFQMVGVTPADDFSEGWANFGSTGDDPTREGSDSVPGEFVEGFVAGSGVANETLPGDKITVTGVEWLDQGIIQKWKKNPSLMLYKLQTNAYKFSWLLIPLSIPFVWLLFAWRRQFKAYDHAVFVTYSLAFMSLLFITMSLLGLMPGGWGSTIAFFLLVIGAPLHLYKQLRHAYGLTRFSAVWRFVALLFFINVVIVLFLQTLLVLGAF